MAEERQERTHVVEIEASAPEQRLPPSWWAQCVVLVGTMPPPELGLVRGRAGTYELVDFALVLVGYAVSGERSLPAFFQAVTPVQEAFMALWARDKLPSASCLSRALGAVTTSTLEAMRTLFFTTC